MFTGRCPQHNDDLLAAARAAADRERRCRLWHMTATLYDRMPGSPPVPGRDGRPLYSQVSGTEHWVFCAALAELILSAGEGTL